MLKKYAFYLILGPASNFLWAFWALPQINEQGSPGETLQWIAVQAILPIFFAVLLYLRKKFVLWLLLIYSGFMILYAAGILGWSMMGLCVPVSIYVVCGVLFVMGFGMLYNSINDMKIFRKVKHYDDEN